jgi:hypothetical protein
VFIFTLLPLYLQERNSVMVEQEDAWAPYLFWTFRRRENVLPLAEFEPLTFLSGSVPE